MKHREQRRAHSKHAHADLFPPCSFYPGQCVSHLVPPQVFLCCSALGSSSPSLNCTAYLGISHSAFHCFFTLTPFNQEKAIVSSFMLPRYSTGFRMRACLRVCVCVHEGGEAAPLQVQCVSVIYLPVSFLSILIAGWSRSPSLQFTKT